MTENGSSPATTAVPTSLSAPVVGLRLNTVTAWSKALAVYTLARISLAAPRATAALILLIQVVLVKLRRRQWSY